MSLNVTESISGYSNFIFRFCALVRICFGVWFFFCCWSNWRFSLAIKMSIWGFYSVCSVFGCVRVNSNFKWFEWLHLYFGSSRMKVDQVFCVKWKATFDIVDNRDHNANACAFRICWLFASLSTAAAIDSACDAVAVVVFTFIPSSLVLLSPRATSFYGVFFNLFLV